MVNVPTFYWDYPKTERFLRYFEQKHNLTNIPCSWETERKRDSCGYQYQAQKQTPSEYKSIKTQLQDLLDITLPRVKTESEIVRQLEQKNIEVRLKGSVGWSFSLNGVAFKASQLGTKYSRRKFMVASSQKEQETRSADANSSTAKGGNEYVTQPWLAKIIGLSDIYKYEREFQKSLEIDLTKDGYYQRRDYSASGEENNK